jgi:hypothetical protein
MKQTSPLVQNLPVLLQLQLPPMMTMMMMENLGQLAKTMYTHLLGSRFVRLLVPTCHHMFTNVSF